MIRVLHSTFARPVRCTDTLCTAASVVRRLRTPRRPSLSLSFSSSSASLFASSLSRRPNRTSRHILQHSSTSVLPDAGLLKLHSLGGPPLLPLSVPLLAMSSPQLSDEEEWVIASCPHPLSAQQQAALLLLSSSASSTPSKARKQAEEETKEEKDGSASSASQTLSPSAASASAASEERKMKMKHRGFLHRLIIPLAAAAAQPAAASSSTGGAQQPVSPLSARSSSSSSSFSSQSSPSPAPPSLLPQPASPNVVSSSSASSSSASSAAVVPAPSSPHPAVSSASSSPAFPYASAPLLSFDTDDIIRVIAKEVDLCNAGWWLGSVVGQSGAAAQPGRFPAAYTHSVTSCAPAFFSSPSITSPSVSLPASCTSSISISALPLSSASSSSSAGPDEEQRGQQKLVDMIRERVSKKKRRYQRDGFDLDLSYITPCIIAMGFPSESFEGLYRNNMQDVQSFLQQRHGDQYKVYNLCSERSYPPDRFPHTARFPFDDHQPSPVNMIDAFCRDAHAWLSHSPQRVIVTHCKAGKGRTGFMIACYLLYCGLFTEAEEALRFYAIRRTKNAKGVTIPSQIRFTHYYQKLLQSHRIPYPLSASATCSLPAPPPLLAASPVLLLAVRWHGLPRGSLNKEISFTIKQADGVYSSHRSQVACIRSSPPSPPSLCLTSCSSQRGIASLQGDVQMQFFATTRFDTVKLFQVWFHTAFLGAEWETVRCRRETESIRRVSEATPTAEAAETAAESGAEAAAVAAAVQCDAIHGDRWELVLEKRHLDKACKDVKHKLFPADFRVELLFAHVL